MKNEEENGEKFPSLGKKVYFCGQKTTIVCTMKIILNDYHKKTNAEKKAKIAYWQEHPLSHRESLRRLRLLREQRLANQSNW